MPTNEATMPAELANIIALHREMFGGWTMQADEQTASNGEEQPQGEATPPAADTPPADADATDWKAEAERLRKNLQEARKWEERAKANVEAAKELEALKAARQDGDEQPAADVAALTNERDTLASELAAARRELAVVRNAGDADASKLLDSRSFMASIADLDPADADAVKTAIGKHVEANSWFRRGPVSSGDVTAGHTRKPAQPKPGMDRLTDAYAENYS